MKKTYEGLYHDTIVHPTDSEIEAAKYNQFRKLMDDLTRRPTLPLDGSRIVLVLDQELVKPGHVSRLTPGIARCRDYAVVSKMMAEWDDGL